MIQPLYPPVQDISAVTEPKPTPPVDIVTSAAAAARYDIEIESWGERLQRAGRRICVWAEDNGAKLGFTCKAPPVQP